MHRLLSTWMTTYWRVFVALAVLTIVEVWIARQEGSKVLLAATLVAFALCKAALVAMYYMHLRYERRLLWYVATLPFVFAAILALGLLADSSLNANKPGPGQIVEQPQPSAEP
jgi:cytochrome c oxidase subunit 4